MEIQLLRIDSRLLHGQITTSWVKSLYVERILVVSTKAANDPMWKLLMEQVAPATVRVNIISLKKMLRIMHDERFSTMKALVLVETPKDAVQLIQAGLSVKEINVGSLSFHAGAHLITDAIAVDMEDMLAFHWLHEQGYSLIAQKVASDAKKELWPILEEKTSFLKKSRKDESLNSENKVNL